MNDRSPTIPTLIDTHAHLDDRRLRDDLAGVLDRAVAAGVAQIIAIGTTVATSAAVLELSRTHAGIFASIGIHPNDVAEVGQEDWPAILDLVTQPGVVAIGETGLDRYWDRTPFPQQQEWFDRHLALAFQHDLPVVIHCRDCQRDILRAIAGTGPPYPRSHACIYRDLG